MEKSLKECSVGPRETSLVGSQSLRHNMKVEKTGVSGGHLQDSVAVGENNGVMCTHHSHGDTYNIIMMEQQLKSRVNDEGSRYGFNDELVHQSKADTKKLRLCVDSRPLNNSSQDEYSDEEFHDCVSTPSPHPPEQHIKDLSFKDDVDRLPVPSPLSPHLGGKRPSMTDIVAMVKNMNVTCAEGAEIVSQFNIQMRDSVQFEEPDIPLNINGKKCVPPSDTTPGTWGLGALVTEDWTFRKDLRKIAYELRLIVKGSIEDTVLIAELSASESEKVFFFLHELYIENILSNIREQPLYSVPGERSDDFGHATVDLRNIKCQIIRSKTKQSVDKIVVLAEISRSALLHSSRYLSKTLFALRRNNNDPT